MTSSSKFHPYRSLRLPGYDYSQAGAYFVTLVTKQRKRLFGEVVDSEMRLNRSGRIVADTWLWLENQYSYIELGAWVVMPDHFHGILTITENRGCGSRTTGASVIARRCTSAEAIPSWQEIASVAKNAPSQ